MGLKALAHAVLERNQGGNSPETTGRKQGNFGGVKPAKKFPDEFKYVACVNCTNLEKGYCTAWGHRPDVPEYEIRLCNKFKQKQMETPPIVVSKGTAASREGFNSDELPKANNP